MAKKLSKNELKLQDSISILEYYNRFAVPLENKFYALSEGRKAGLCPFHDETDASFHFWEENKMYHCFGCGRSGNIVKMHQEFEWIHHKRGIDKTQAMNELAQLFGVTLEAEDFSDDDGLTVFQKAKKSLSDKTLYVIDKDTFSLAKFRQLNNMLRNLNVPIEHKVENYAELDRQASIFYMSNKNS